MRLPRQPEESLFDNLSRYAGVVTLEANREAGEPKGRRRSLSKNNGLILNRKASAPSTKGGGPSFAFFVSLRRVGTSIGD